MDLLVHHILCTAVAYELGDTNSGEGSFGFSIISHFGWLHMYKLLTKTKLEENPEALWTQAN